MARGKQIKREPKPSGTSLDTNAAYAPTDLGQDHPPSSGDTEIDGDNVMTEVDQAKQIPATGKLYSIKRYHCPNLWQQTLRLTAKAKAVALPWRLVLPALCLPKVWNFSAEELRSWFRLSRSCDN